MSTKDAWNIAGRDTLFALALFAGVMVYAVLGRGETGIVGGISAAIAVLVAGRTIVHRRRKAQAGHSSGRTGQTARPVGDGHSTAAGEDGDGNGDGGDGN